MCPYLRSPFPTTNQRNKFIEEFRAIPSSGDPGSLNLPAPSLPLPLLPAHPLCTAQAVPAASTVPCSQPLFYEAVSSTVGRCNPSRAHSPVPADPKFVQRWILPENQVLGTAQELGPKSPSSLKSLIKTFLRRFHLRRIVWSHNLVNFLSPGRERSTKNRILVEIELSTRDVSPN